MQIRSQHLGAASLLATLLLAAAPAGAQNHAAATGDAMSSMANVPCDQAASAMTAAMQHSAAMAPEAQTGGHAMAASTDVDKTFAAMMTTHAKAMMDMAKLESRCGKDKKAKDAADQYQLDLQRMIQTLQIF